MVALTHTPFKINPALSSLKTGVYVIRNRVNGKVYAGSAAVSFRKRWNTHRSDLRKNKHHCTPLQRSWNKHGEGAFEFLIIAKCIPKWCMTMEQVHMNRLRSSEPDNGYNLCPASGSRLGLPHTQESRNKMSEKSKLRKHSAESRKKISESKKNPSKETRAKNSAAAIRMWRNPEIREKIIRSVMAKSPEDRSRAARSSWTDEKRAALSIKMRGRKLSEDHRRKLSESHIGKTHSLDVRAKMSASHKGKKFSKETCLKISAHAKLRSKEFYQKLSLARMKHEKKRLAAYWAWRKNYKVSNETRKKISEGNKRRKIKIA